jgi:hypothetical protein
MMGLPYWGLLVPHGHWQLMLLQEAVEMTKGPRSYGLIEIRQDSSS